MQDIAFNEHANDKLAAPTRLRQLSELGGPPGLPFVGNALQIKRERVHLDIEGMCQLYGPYFVVQFGRRKLLVVADHEATNQVLKARPHDFRRSTRLAEAASSLGMALGVFMAEGEQWHHQRRMVMASFAPQRIRSYFPTMLNVLKRLQGRWQTAAENGHTIDLQADLMRYTVDAITGLAFGHDVNTLQADGDVIQRHLDAIFPALFKRILSVFPWWRVIKLPADRQLANNLAEISKAIEGFISDARERMRQDPSRRAEPPNLLEAFIAAAETPGSGVNDADVKGNVVTMLLAGEDTTANTLAWLIYLLHQNPNAHARVQQELNAIAPRGLTDFTPDALGRMDFLEACANEAMRLKPVAPFLPVQALRDTVIHDIAVPKGTLVWNVMRHDSVSEQHLSDPLDFKPERWLDQSRSPAKHLSMPFGSGPRICPGRYLALLEIKMAIAMLVSHFDIISLDTPDGQAAKEIMAFTMGPESLRLRLQPKVKVS